MKRWYAIRSKPHGEQRARLNLEQQGFEAWLPLYAKKRRHARKLETVIRPLFPRYLFVRMDLTAERWRAVLSTYGVTELIGNADGPTAVPDGVIEAMQARAGPDGRFTLHRARLLEPGTRVRVLDGPMGGIEAIFQTANDTERVTILLELMGRQHAVTVPATDIEAI